MSLFEPGMKVTINPNIQRNMESDLFIVNTYMCSLRGQTFTVKEIKEGHYFMEEIDHFAWHEDWLLPPIYLPKELFEL